MCLPHWCVYFQLICNTVDFYKWKLNSTWSWKWIICRRITEYTCWSVGVQLTHHVMFCTCHNSMLNEILACVGMWECDRMPFIDRPEHSKQFKEKLGFLDPRPQLEGSYKIGSVHLSILLPILLSILPSVSKFSENWLISFFVELCMMLGAHI